jgi:hypothetical protein
VSSGDFVLGTPPDDPRSHELWLQHAAGFVIFEDIRGYALAQLAPDLDDQSRAIASRAIDDTIYGLMMVIDGVPAPLRNADYEVRLRTLVRLSRRGEPGEIIKEMDLFDGDGMCMGYHNWVEGDFGQDPVALGRAEAS